MKQGSQFFHHNTYSRKLSGNARKSKGKQWTASDIASEMQREDGHCPHVVNPQEPQHICGLEGGQIVEALESFLDENKIEVQLKDGRTAMRSAKRDAHVLGATVFSWPEPTEDFNEEKANAFFRDCIEFTEKTFGKVQSAYAHFDESFPHIHVYSFGSNARRNHPGWRAKQSVLDAGGSSKDANKAYKDAMKELQDQFWLEVGQKHGLDRYGPKRQRLTRDAWKERKEALAKTAEARQKLEAYAERLQERRVEIEGSVQESEANLGRLNQEAEAKKQEVLKAEGAVKAAENRCKSKRKELGKLEGSLVAKIDDLRELDDQIEAKERDLDKLEQRKVIAQATGGFLAVLRGAFYKAIGKEPPEVREAREALEQDKAKVKKDRTAITALRRSVVGQMEELTGQISELKAEVEDERLAAAEAEAELGNVQRELSQTESYLREAQMENRALKAENKRLKEQLGFKDI